MSDELNPPTGHGWDFKKAKQEYLKGLAKDPNQPKWIREHIKRELELIKQGKRKTIRVPKGYNVGHKKPAVGGGANKPSNFQLEHAKGNTAKGPRERKFWRLRWIKRLLDALKKLKGAKKVSLEPPLTQPRTWLVLWHSEITPASVLSVSREQSGERQKTPKPQSQRAKR